MRWAEKQRQNFIADHVKTQGYINRKDIINEFYVSLPQASRDMRVFIKANPKTLRYNVSLKRYEGTDA